MKRERGQSAPTNTSKTQQSTGKTKAGSKKNSALNIDQSSATEKTRGRHGHGMNNEGTNVNYEEER